MSEQPKLQDVEQIRLFSDNGLGCHACSVATSNRELMTGLVMSSHHVRAVRAFLRQERQRRAGDTGGSGL